MKLDNSKIERINTGISIWEKHNYRGILKYVPRFGKTLAGFTAIEKYASSKEFFRVVILTPSLVIKNQWGNKYQQYINSGWINDLPGADADVITAHEVIQYKGTYFRNPLKCDLLIVDEIHKFATEEFHKIITQYIDYSHILGLTGSDISGDYKDIIEDECPIIDSISEEEAIAKKWIADNIEYNIGLDMTDLHKDSYAKHTEVMEEIYSIFRGVSDYILDSNGDQIFDSDFNLIMACYKGTAIRKKYFRSNEVCEFIAKRKGWSNNLDLSIKYNKDIDDHWNPVTIKANAELYNINMRNRFDLITNNIVKTRATIELLTYLQDRTSIVFNDSKEFCELIVNMTRSQPNINGTYYHSYVKGVLLYKDKECKEVITKADKKTPKPHGKVGVLKDAIKGLASGKYTFISTVKALDTGFDVPEINTVIATSGSANFIQQDQRNARSKTIDFANPNKVAIIINLYFKDFILNEKEYKNRDYVKLLDRQKNSKDVIELDSLSDLFNIY